MITAFVLVHCEPGFENQMKNEISRIPEVIDVEVTYGIYDMVCKIETPNEKSLMDIILNDIRGISKNKGNTNLAHIFLMKSIPFQKIIPLYYEILTILV